MPATNNREKLSVAEMVRQMSDQMIPLGNRFSYFPVALPLSEDDIKEYLVEPISALPPSLRAMLPKVAILLVPYLEKGPGTGHAGEPPGDLVCFEEPDSKRQIASSKLVTPAAATLAFGLKGREVAEYHYQFFRLMATLAAETCGDDIYEKFDDIVRDELTAGAHGEVDEDSWELKRALLRRQRNLRRRTKGFAKYARRALVDTLTLFLHGICCDIDVQTGPRQLASRYLRRRLDLLQSTYPPPEGYAVFPEDLNHVHKRPGN